MNQNIEIQRYSPEYSELMSFLNDTNFTAPVSVDVYARKVLRSATFIAIKDNGRVIGMSIVYTNRQEKDFAYLTYISIINEYQGRGLGKMLLNQTKLESKSRGFRTIKLEVNKSNAIARNLYESSGFVYVGSTTTSFYMECVI